MLNYRHELHVPAANMFKELIHLQSFPLRSIADCSHGIELNPSLTKR